MYHKYYMLMISAHINVEKKVEKKESANFLERL